MAKRIDPLLSIQGSIVMSTLEKPYEAISIIPGLEMVGDNLLVRVLKEKKSRGGIIMPDTVSNKGLKRGTVVARGPGHWQAGSYKPIQAQINDEVWFHRGKIGNEAMVCEVQVEDEDYLVVSEQIVLLVVKD